MLELFRKYQRILFIFVTVVIIVTFSLFGSYKTLGQTGKRKEIVVGRAIDGSDLKYFDIKQLGAILGAESAAAGVIGQDLLKTGVAERLAVSFSDRLQPDWQARLDRLKRWRFYVHPSAPFLNAEQIWNQLAPGAVDELHLLQQMEEAGPDFFVAWSRLFSLQERCPSELIRRILLYHQNQYHIPNDPRILSDDFSLCGFRSAQEWFGANFIDLISQLIINGAIGAESKGFIATPAEAEADLVRRFSSKNANLDMVLRTIGVRKTEAVRLWQRTLLFLRYFQTVGRSVLVDDLPYRQMAQYAGESAVIDVFQLPAELQLHCLDDFLSFEIYARLACAPFEPGSLPSTLLSAEAVAKNAPELVYDSFQINAARIDLSAIQSHVPLKDVWDWQIQPDHWESLQSAFPEMIQTPGKTPFQVLEKLDPDLRSRIDGWARRMIVESHPEWVEQEWTAAESKPCDVAFFENGDIDGIAIHQTADFRSLIDRASGQDSAAIESLKAYREGQTIWRIDSIQKKTEKSVLSLADAKAKRRIPIESFLEERYRTVREETPALFQNDKGDWLPFGEIRELAIRQIFASVFRSIDRAMGIIDEMQPLSFYASRRFYGFMNDSLAKIQADPQMEPGGLWPIVKERRTVARTSSRDWIMTQPFHVKTGEWSDVYASLNGEILFFYVSGRTQIPTPIFDQIRAGQETLASDVKCYLADRLIADAIKKQAIVFPVASPIENNDDL